METESSKMEREDHFGLFLLIVSSCLENPGGNQFI